MTDPIAEQEEPTASMLNPNSARRLTSAIAGTIAAVQFTTLGAQLASPAPQPTLVDKQPAIDWRIVATEQSGPRIIFIDGAPGAKAEVLWAWDPKADPGIADKDKPSFGYVSECKPRDNGKTILVVASEGAFAAIDVATSRALWYGFAGGNPHSIEVLPDKRVAVISSTGAKLQIFDVSKHPFEPEQQQKTIALEIEGGHGLHWDSERNCLWALGYYKLQKLAYDSKTMSVKVLDVYDYTESCGDPAGHDLLPDGRGGLFFTNWHRVSRFDPKTGSFESARDVQKVKCFSPSKTRGDLYTIPNESWWTDRLEVRDSTGASRIVGPFNNPKFYKARWLMEDAPMAVSGK